MDEKAVAINAANLHVGGGVQVATSFIQEVSRLPDADRLCVFVSSEVHENLASLGVSQAAFREYQVVDVYGLGLLISPLRKELNRFDVVFTVFGPHYQLNRRFHSVVGFAQSWIIYPNNEAYARLPLGEKLRERAKFLIQKRFFASADTLVVELEHVREGLRALGFTAPIAVVHNCLSEVYRRRQDGQGEEAGEGERPLSLGIITRDYPHKNLDILPLVKSALKRRYALEAEFHVTLNDQEWQARSEEFRRLIINVGPIRVRDCPDFYRRMDAVIFPSLLECFSASPLEAMAMKKPLFASDRGFVRDVCGEYALYVDPLDPEDIADAIQRYFHGDLAGSLDLDGARRHALGFSCQESRARQYLTLMLEAAEAAPQAALIRTSSRASPPPTR
jgi:glycosyltransferase involved in cell wall biosynthesis